MQNAASSASAQSGGRNDSYRAVVSDLEALIQQVQASIKLIETAMVGESPLGNEEIAASVVILDDVTPRYIRAAAALSSSTSRIRRITGPRPSVTRSTSSASIAS